MGKYQYVRKTARYNGKQYEATGKTELEALTKLAEKLAAAKRGEEVISGSMTVDTWFARWYETYKAPKGMTDKSRSMYREKYQNYISPAIGRMKLRDVTDVHLQRILNEQAGRSASHVKKVRLVIRSLFDRARKSRLIAYDPSEDLELPAMTENKRRSITEEERAAILKAAETHPAGLWVLTMLYTGMRPGETAALRWVDVDFEHNEIHVHAAKESGRNAVKGTKTAAGVRDIPMHSALSVRLRKARKGPFEYVFSHHGKMADDNALQRWWRSFIRYMDIQQGAERDYPKICVNLQCGVE